MKTITSFICVAFALSLGPFALLLQVQAVVPPPDGVSLDDNPSLALQDDSDSTSPELAGVETQTVLGLYNSSTHETRLWYMNNNVHVGTVAGPHVPDGWSPVSAADFNGDGHIDVLLLNPTTRQTWIGYLFGAIQGAYGPTLPSGFVVIATADFNHDGHPDFLIQNSRNAGTRIWYMNNNKHVGTVFPGLSLFAVVGVSDFNRDGNPDYLEVRPQLGFTYFIRYGNNLISLLPHPPQPWYMAGATDFNGGGRADILLYNPSTRQTAIWYMNNNIHIGSATGPVIPSGYNLFAP